MAATAPSCPYLPWMAHRRIAVLSAHLRLTDTAPPSAPHRPPRPDGPPLVAPASCCSGSDRGAGRESAAERDGEEGCVFCRIVRGESPAFKLYEDEVCICILDRNPLILGHSLIIPKSHSQSLDATPPPVVAAMCSKIPFLSSCIMKATQSDSFNLLVNNGSTAGQVIFHTHLHIIPRKAGDQLWPSENCKRKPIESNQKIVDLVNSIRDMVSSPFQNNC